MRDLEKIKMGFVLNKMKEVAMTAEKRKNLVTIVYEKELGSLIRDFLNGDTYDVASAADGMDAFHKLAKEYFDLIITDVQMPGLGGVNLLPRLRRIQPWARLIVIPTKRMKRRDREIMESAADICLEKPFRIEQLKEIIQRMFSATDGQAIPSKKEWESGRLSLEVG